MEINAVGGDGYFPVSMLKDEPAPASKLIYSKYKDSPYYFKPILKDRLSLYINQYHYNKYTVDGKAITEYKKFHAPVPASFKSYVVKTEDVIEELTTWYGGGRRKQTRSKSRSKKQTRSKSRSKKQTRSKSKSKQQTRSRHRK